MLVALLFLFSLSQALDHILFNLPPHPLCFSATPSPNTTLFGEILVTNHAETSISFTVTAANRTLVSKSEVEHEKFSFPISESVEHTLCIYQTPPHPSHRPKVYVTYSNGEDDNYDSHGALRQMYYGKSTRTQMADMMDVVEEVQRNVQQILDEIDRIREGERRFFEHMKALQNWIWIMGVLSCIVVLTVGWGQGVITQDVLNKFEKGRLGKGM